MKSAWFSVATLLIATPAFGQGAVRTAGGRSFDELYVQLQATMSAGDGLEIAVMKLKENGGDRGEKTPMCAIALTQRDFFRNALDLANRLPPRPENSTISPALVAARLKQAPAMLEQAEALIAEACAAA